MGLGRWGEGERYARRVEDGERRYEDSDTGRTSAKGEALDASTLMHCGLSGSTRTCARARIRTHSEGEMIDARRLGRWRDRGIIIIIMMMIISKRTYLVLAVRGNTVRLTYSYPSSTNMRYLYTCIIYRQLVHLSLSLSLSLSLPIIFPSFPARTSNRASGVPVSAISRWLLRRAGSPVVDPDIRSDYPFLHTLARTTMRY